MLDMGATKPSFELVFCLWSRWDLGMSKVFAEDLKENTKPCKLPGLNNTMHCDVHIILNRETVLHAAN